MDKGKGLLDQETNTETTTRYHRTAGGVVLDDKNNVLALKRVVQREGKPVNELRLPKGHIDPGETEETAALREVREESGYAQLRIVADLGEAQSRFFFRGCDNVRDERYFLMRLDTPERGAPEPQGEEEALFEPVWLSIPEAIAQLSYPSEQEFARRALAQCNG